MIKRIIAVAIAIGCLAPSLALSQIAVTGYTGTDGTALVDNILGPGGFTLVGTPSYTGVSGQAGFFTAGSGSGITINQGILLTSGQATLAQGPNNSPNAGRDNGTGGYGLLNSLAGGYTYDANVLTFTFHANEAGQVHFNYVFASEEYNEFVGSQYNDVFGFFLDGNNVALLPGTTTPVSINNVNQGKNSADYINNSAGGSPPYNIQYDGFTIPLTVSADITAGDHTITLAIADTSDHIYDSAVFIEGGTFDPKPKPPGVPDGGSTLALLTGAFTVLGTFSRRFRK